MAVDCSVLYGVGAESSVKEGEIGSKQSIACPKISGMHITSGQMTKLST